MIERIHQYNREYNLRPYDSVRGVFSEGNPVYDNSEINGRRRLRLLYGDGFGMSALSNESDFEDG